MVSLLVPPVPSPLAQLPAKYSGCECLHRMHKFFSQANAIILLFSNCTDGEYDYIVMWVMTLYPQKNVNSLRALIAFFIHSWPFHTYVDSIGRELEHALDVISNT
ncbi:hypothetical protein M378DRAFT_559218 [Amanita muscaria Koide BX008]|uniref:Uncharacterized protein n=1 Tax=Amanita muscaria (strain Koide BX008) TaxID=946122 RepID=A0A0C2WTL0_AMAMK|nr:hypothetical protein M378DRAFT_559218 [Amanita muscaria Koide BX008]